MPNRSLPFPLASLTRRTTITTLAVGVGSLWAGCTNKRNPTESSPQQGAGTSVGHTDRVDPDATVASTALANEQATLDAVEATSARHPQLAEILSPVIAAHNEHLGLLADAAPDPATDAAPGAGAAASPSPSPSGPAEPGPRRYRVPRAPQAALAGLSANEQNLSTSTKRHAFVAQSGAFARLLASMAASAAQHAVVLDRPLPTRLAKR